MPLKIATSSKLRVISWQTIKPNVSFRNRSCMRNIWGTFMMLRLLVLLFATPVFGAELKGMTFDDTITVDGKKLVLNALGSRRVSQFGLPIKVYVGGFYVPKKITSREEMLKVERPVFFRMAYLVSADQTKITDGWKAAFDANCEIDCEKAKPGLAEFNKLVTESHKGSVMTVKITKEGVEIENPGKPDKKGVIKN